MIELKALDLFIFSRFLSYFLGSLGVLIILFLSVDIMTNLNRFGSTASVLISYYIYYVPFIVYNMIPVSALLALVFLVTGMVRTSELVALHSLGYGLFRILRVVFICLILLYAFLVWAGDYLIPQAMEKRNYIYYVDMKKLPGRYAKTKTKNIWYRTKDSIIHFETVLDEKNIEGVKIYFLNKNWGLKRLLEAKNLVLKDKTWLLKKVKDSQLSDNEDAFQIKTLEDLEIQALTELESMKMLGSNTNYLSTKELLSLIKKNEEISLNTTSLKVNLFSKFSFALAVFILPLLGLTTVSTNRRSGNVFLSGSIAIFLVFAYWMIYNMGLSFGKAEVLPVFFAVFFAPILALICIVFAIKRVLN